MPVKPLDLEEKKLLLTIARQALEEAVKGHSLPILKSGPDVRTPERNRCVICHPHKKW